MTKPIPDREEIPCHVNAVLEPLDRRLREVSSRSFPLAEVERLITMFDDPKAWEGVDCWDHATQRYLALVPFYKAIGGGSVRQLVEGLGVSGDGVLQDDDVTSEAASPMDHLPP